MVVMPVRRTASVWKTPGNPAISSGLATRRLLVARVYPTLARRYDSVISSSVIFWLFPLTKPTLNCRMSPCLAVAPATVTTFSTWIYCSSPGRESMAALTSDRFIMTKRPVCAVFPIWNSCMPWVMRRKTCLASSALTGRFSYMTGV